MSGPHPSSPPRHVVLIVDDSPDTLGFLTEALEQSGYSVLIATSGLSALDIVDRITPDMILLDAMMPEIDGFETCVRLKKNAKVSHVPVIFMTGLTDVEHVVRALGAGGVDYVTKPVNISELTARIRVHLANARSTQNARAALDMTGRHLVAVGTDGSIQWSTQQALRLIHAATGSDDGLERQRARIGQWLEARTGLAGTVDKQLVFESTDGPALQMQWLGPFGNGEHLFRLTIERQISDDAQLRESFSLTAREAEVLVWIAKGKSNRDIGEILGLSSRTVNKHLEQVYVKLGVENRASAAVKASSVLLAQ